MAMRLAPMVTRLLDTSGDRATAEARLVEAYAAALAAHAGRPGG
jgi:hypothetical protein